MSSFSDLQTASKTRDIIERITQGVLRRERPEPRIGKVFDYSLSTQTARILFAGETIDDLITVSFAKNMTPVTYMDLTYDVDGISAPGDIVRVWGKTGNYFLLDYIWGGPDSSGAGMATTDALHLNPSFEDSTPMPGGSPTSWDFFWGSGTAYTTESDVFSGTRAVVVDTSASAGGSKACFSSTFSVQPGDSVTFSVWAKAVSGAPLLDPALMTRTTGNPGYFDGANTTIQNATSVLLTSTWTKYEYTFTVPSGHTTCRLHFRINQSTSGVQAVAVMDLSASSKVSATNQFLPSGTWIKEACNAATTANISNLATGAPNSVDGVTVTSGMRILVKDQSTATQNGIYTVQVIGSGSDGTWVRTSDAGTSLSLAGSMVTVLAGTTWGGTTFKTSFKSTDTVGGSAMHWSPTSFSRAGFYQPTGGFTIDTFFNGVLPAGILEISASCSGYANAPAAAAIMSSYLDGVAWTAAGVTGAGGTGGSVKFFFNQAGVHMTFPTLFARCPIVGGTHTLGLWIMAVCDANDQMDWAIKVLPS